MRMCAPDCTHVTPTREDLAVYDAESLEWAEMVLPAYNETICHCGEPVAYGFDGGQTHTRGMCAHCDSVRCDVDPFECGR